MAKNSEEYLKAIITDKKEGKVFVDILTKNEIISKEFKGEDFEIGQAVNISNGKIKPENKEPDKVKNIKNFFNDVLDSVKRDLKTLNSENCSEMAQETREMIDKYSQVMYCSKHNITNNRVESFNKAVIENSEGLQELDSISYRAEKLEEKIRNNSQTEASQEIEKLQDSIEEFKEDTKKQEQGLTNK
ncbi:MAG: hypothetical protein IJ837_03180 [Clostridia bacterium]|nr:hypothetical protein [Clostridia bacterium]